MNNRQIDFFPVFGALQTPILVKIAHSFPPSSLRRRCFMLIVSPKKVVGWGGGNQNVEGDLLAIGYLMLDDYLPFHDRLFHVGRLPWIPLLSANSYLMIPFLENKKVQGTILENKKVQGDFLFMFFDRYEIHIQTFLLFINGRINNFQSSSSQNIFYK